MCSRFSDNVIHPYSCHGIIQGISTPARLLAGLLAEKKISNEFEIFQPARKFCILRNQSLLNFYFSVIVGLHSLRNFCPPNVTRSHNIDRTDCCDSISPSGSTKLSVRYHWQIKSVTSYYSARTMFILVHFVSVQA